MQLLENIKQLCSAALSFRNGTSIFCLQIARDSMVVLVTAPQTNCLYRILEFKNLKHLKLLLPCHGSSKKTYCSGTQWCCCSSELGGMSITNTSYWSQHFFHSTWVWPWKLVGNVTCKHLFLHEMTAKQSPHLKWKIWNPSPKKVWRQKFTALKSKLSSA